MNAVLTLTHNCGVVVQDDIVSIRKSVNKYTTFFSLMFEPFLLGYWVKTSRIINSFHVSVRKFVDIVSNLPLILYQSKAAW